MGKIKRERQKYHIAAEGGHVVKTDEQEHEPKKTSPIKFPFNSVPNIFAGINIKLSDINHFEETSTTPNKCEPEKKDAKEEYQALTKISNTHDKSKILTKKEKMALKHQQLMEKLDVTQQARLKNQRKKPKKQMDTDNLLSSSQFDHHSLPFCAPLAENNDNGKPMSHAVGTPFNDGLPAINSLAVEKDIFRIQAKSKLISKKSEDKKNFVKNYNFLKKAMTKKKN